MKKTLISTSLSAIILGGGGAITVSAQDYEENQVVTQDIEVTSGTTTSNFKGNNTLKGGITAKNGTNTVTFEKGVNTIDATSGKIGITGYSGKVDVTFKDGTTSNTIKGQLYTGYRRATNVTMKGSVSNTVEGYLFGQSSGSTLNLTFSGEKENKLIGTGTNINNAINGDGRKAAIYADYASLNVNFDNNAGTNTIEGDIVAENGIVTVNMGNLNTSTSNISLIQGDIVTNRINTKDSADNKPKIFLNMNSGTNSIIGNLKTGKGKVISGNRINSAIATVTFRGNENTLKGNIDSIDGGETLIYFDKTNSNNTFEGNINTIGDHNGSMNFGRDWYPVTNIQFKNNEGNNTFTGNITTREAWTIIDMGIDNNTKVSNTLIGDISTIQRTTQGGNELGITYITMDGKTNTLKGNIWADGNAKTYIAMNGTTNLYEGTSNVGWGTNNFKFSGGETTVNGTFISKAISGSPANTNVEFGSNKNTLKGNILSENTASTNVKFTKGENIVNGNIGVFGRQYLGTTSVVVDFKDQTTKNTINGDVYSGYQGFVKVSMSGTTSNKVNGIVRGDSDGSKLDFSIGSSNGSVHNVIEGKTIDIDNKERKTAILANYATLTTTIAGKTDIKGDVFTFGGTNDITINSGTTTIDGSLISKNQGRYIGKTNISLNDTSGLIVKDGVDISNSSFKVAVNINNSKSINGENITLSSRALDVDTNGKMDVYFDNVHRPQRFSGNITTNADAKINLNVLQGKLDIDARNLKITGSGINNLDFKGNDSIIHFGGNANHIKISNLTTNGMNNTIDITSNQNSNAFTLLEIGNKPVVNTITRATQASGISGNYNFMVYTDPTKENGVLGDTNNKDYGNVNSDRIVINEESKEKLTQTLFVVVDPNHLDEISYQEGKGTETKGNIAVATVKNSNSNIDFVAEDVINGAEVLAVDLTKAQTDEYGKVGNGSNGYTTYFIKDVKTVKVDESVLSAASSALVINYDLYLANFNSINKRMGELRNSNESVGVWGRIFGGSQKTDFGLGSQTEYITTQFGVDKILKIDENANMFLGAAFAYSNSKTNVNQIKRQGNVVGGSEYVGLNNVESDGYELGLYASYVADKGWYNDTIGKVGYIQSDFNFDGSVDASKVKNITMTISNETGYRYDFGKTDDWYIEPQVELGFGYILGSKFTANIKTSLGTSLMEAKHPDIFMLRSKAGATLGKRFVGDKGAATLYFGTFYEYDYVENSENSIILGGRTTASAPSLSSSGRVVLNLGSNVELTERARMYIDVEKTFGDKTNTHMQFNFGTRYSF